MKSLTHRAKNILVDTFRTAASKVKEPKSTKSSQERLNRKISLKTILNEEGTTLPQGIVSTQKVEVAHPKIPIILSSTQPIPKKN